jgi:S-formylglutathione hydrolase FrmB
MRKKGRSWGQNPEKDDSPILLVMEMIPFTWEASSKANQKAFKELIGHDQKDSWKKDDVLAFVNTLMVNTFIASSLELILVTVGAYES